MKKLKVNLKKEIDKSYPIIISKNIIFYLAEELRKNPIAFSYAIISDSIVAKLYGEKLFEQFKNAGLKAHLFTFPYGEENKSRKIWESLISKMLRAGLGRDSCVIAIGGGVVIDMAGFVASTYMRGIPWIVLPTSLLAMVDASVGGKVGIDLVYGKNLVGSFWQPKAVYIDVDFLQTLPQAHLKNGLAEVAKTGFIKDAELISLLEQKTKDIFSKDAEILEEMIFRSLKVKARVVEKDEEEKTGLRKILNYGHTIGHALEAFSDYKLLHGWAVSLGMIVASKISYEIGFLSSADLKGHQKILNALDLPIKLPKSLAKKLKTASGKKRFFDYLYKDKKKRGEKIEMVLLEKIGKVKKYKGNWTVPVEEKLIERGVEAVL